MEQLENAYKNFKDAKITLQEFKQLILKIVYENKPYFELSKLDPDRTTEVLIALEHYLEKIIHNLDESKGSFSTLIHHSIIYLSKTIFYTEMKKTSNEKAIVKYYISETSSNLSEYTPEYKVLNKINIQEEFRNLIRVNKVKKLSEQEKILILILKSCYYINQNHIEILAQEFNIPLKKIEFLIEEAKKTLTNKITKSKIQSESANRVFILKNRYSNQLKYLTEDSYTYKKIQKSLDFTMFLWDKYANKNSTPPITPTNSCIARLLNIPLHCVRTLFVEISKKYRKKS